MTEQEIRQQKLLELRQKKKIAEDNYDSFINQLNGKIIELNSTLANGIDINKVDEVIVQLEEVSSLRNEFNELTKTFTDFKFPVIPESIKLTGLEAILTAVKEIKPTVKILKEEDVYSTYKAANTDEEDENQMFFGFVNSQGNWFILQEFGSTNKTYTYAAGKSEYKLAWDKRREQTYKLYSEVQL